ncbi:MAG: glutamine--fructose-6-phosphate transaminase (isomerizing) [Bacilli bacterium]|jgi:glucosamine--fructose-6-phosphate aminotransferase (isomerizing)|nr:glutamine--fructose-6-phosphate transaminase (isomerizing) [Bacilli bacterium]
MCGMIGYIGKKPVVPILLKGLQSLEYRGYDSAGIAYMKDQNVQIMKEVGKVNNLKKHCQHLTATKMGLGHTRWATHGVANQVNAHPQRNSGVTIVHNGIIENYELWKQKLLEKGYQFQSDTDTEVACAVISEAIKQSSTILEGLEIAQTQLEGSYAFGIIVDQDPNHLYAMKQNSPLIVGVCPDGYLIASDIPAVLTNTNEYQILEDGDIAILSEQRVTVYNQGIEQTKNIQTITEEIDQVTKDGYEHYMRKEIQEQPAIVASLVSEYLGDQQSHWSDLPDLTAYQKIDIVACGSAWHAGMIGKMLIERYAKIPVQCYIASEYRYQPHFLDSNSLVIVISQSGETADTLASLTLAKQQQAKTLAIVNVARSSIARAADQVILTKAGCEIAVATTKAFMAQITILSLLAFKTAKLQGLLSEKEIRQIEEDYKTLPLLLEACIYQGVDQAVVKHLATKEHAFYLGRQIDYALALEGALKLKEISYIHCEAYAAGELKHGTISLIEQETPVICIVTDPAIASKTISNLKEVKARGSYNFLIVTDQLNFESDVYQDKLILPSLNPLLQPMITTIPLQLLAYQVAKERFCDIDQPRNLAKSVTVE